MEILFPVEAASLIAEARVPELVVILLESILLLLEEVSTKIPSALLPDVLISLKVSRFEFAEEPSVIPLVLVPVVTILFEVMLLLRVEVIN